MRNPRLFIPGGIHFITFRTEEGLPFVPLRFMNMLMCSAMARAQRLYPVKIICFVVQANHVHMLIRVTDPELISNFIRYFKAESAHYLNRLLNRRQRTVWAERFDSPAVLDLDKALELFAYCTLNPVKDGLVHSMSEYPGVSSYSYLMNQQNYIPAKSIPRDKVPILRDPTHPRREDEKLSAYFSSDEFPDISIALSPEDLRLAFHKSKEISPESFRNILLDTLASFGALYVEQRSKKEILGAAKLLAGSILSPRNPPTKGRRMICLSSIKELRQSFISSFKHLRALCRNVFRKWQQGDTRTPYPPGMFAPHVPRVSNFIPSAVYYGRREGAAAQ